MLNHRFVQTAPATEWATWQVHAPLGMYQTRLSMRYARETTLRATILFHHPPARAGILAKSTTSL